MAAPVINLMPPAPSPVDSSDVFDAKAFAFTLAMNPFATQANELAVWVGNQASAAAQSSDSAEVFRDETVTLRGETEALRDETEALKDSAASMVNFVGLWSELSGPLNIPAVVYHDGIYWSLLTNLTDVTTSEPSAANADWLRVYAASSDTAAAQSAEEALLSQVAAKDSEDAAQLSAAEAGDAEAAAKASEIAAGNSEAAAGNSEAAAAQSAAEALASETASANSAAAASDSADSAQSLLEDFQGRYYGPYASPPTQGPNGNPRDTGDIYYDTSVARFFVFSGTDWIDALGDVGTMAFRDVFISTAAPQPTDGQDGDVWLQY